MKKNQNKTQKDQNHGAVHTPVANRIKVTGKSLSNECVMLCAHVLCSVIREQLDGIQMNTYRWTEEKGATANVLQTDCYEELDSLTRS